MIYAIVRKVSLLGSTNIIEVRIVHTNKIYKRHFLLYFPLKGQFWKAPELLRNPNIYGTPKGDVYAFAIIMYEIVIRKGPFGQTAYEPKEIVDLVKKLPSDGDAPFRPEIECIIEGEYCPDYVLACIKECWDEDPEVRPDFQTIR